MKALTIASFNAGLLKLNACGCTVLEPAPFTEKRLEHIPNALAGLDADVILLQEVYRKEHSEWLAHKLDYPYVVHSRDHFPMRSGLMVLSKYRLTGHYIPFNERILEDRIADKGMIVATVLAPWANIAIANVHPTAGGRLHPEHPTIERVRETQLSQAMEELGRLADVTDCRILAGDFNAGPEASQRNFQHVLRHGYRDTFTANETLRYTWDPNNPLNAQGPHAHCPPQRCDHILVQGKTLKAETRIVLAEPIVDAPNGACTLSDHFGLLANITF